MSEELREYAEKRLKEIQENAEKRISDIQRKCDRITDTCNHLSTALRKQMTPEELARAEELDRKAEKEELER